MAAITQQESAWYTLGSDVSAHELKVDPKQGLSTTEAELRLKEQGANVLTADKKEPFWQSLLRQYRDYMQIILLIAAGASLIIQDFSTALLLIVLTLVNAMLGLRQERKAEESVGALQKMMETTARVRRNGETMEIPAANIVPGDIVLFEAGDRVPADGRLTVAASLEIEESALTGESTPVGKNTDSLDKVDLPLGDRVNMAYMNSNVTRGRGELLVTETGMGTEVGHIAHMLSTTQEEKAPLTQQVDRLTLIIAGVTFIALIGMIVIGLSNQVAFDELFNMAIALAIAAIPTGLPVIVTTVLTIGTTQLAQQNAIVKNLPAVETLGSTSAICSDKTGTLTLNQMTAKEFAVAGNRYSITGQGYSADGEIRHVAGKGDVDLDPILLPMVLCADAVVEDGALVGDPTEGALVVLAQKGGISVRHTRDAYPRIAEVPFDSDYKFMATFHNMEDDAGNPVVKCYVKGAPDVVIGRSTMGRNATGETISLSDENRQLALDENDRIGELGMRVMVVAERNFDPKTFDPKADLLSEMHDLTLLGIVGIVDPPRPTAKDAIAECKSAGIRVRMITGDHAVTAAAIAKELGIPGRAITGAEFKQMSDDEVIREIDNIGVIARVAPEDKVRLVQMLQQTNKIVAMTGDGVNDAPALKAANIGVAMGITGTDVSKEAATMILTDDNFATIVASVEQGRAIYDNLLKYIRFQLAGLFAFILAFLGAALFGLTLQLFTPLQIIFVNFGIQSPIGITLGQDKKTPGLMEKKPRPADEPIVSTALAIRLIIIGLIVALFAILAYQYALNTTGSEVVAQTMAMVMFSVLNIPVALNLRFLNKTVFRMETFSNPALLYSFGWVLLSMVLITELPLFQRLFDTESLTLNQWGICLGASVLFLLVSEVIKLILRLIRFNPER